MDSTEKIQRLRSGTPRTLHGISYEIKLLMFYTSRFHDKKSHFEISSGWDKVKIFNSVVINYMSSDQEKIVFILAKHKKEPTKIDNYKWFSAGAFEEFFLSYLEVMKNEVFQDIPPSNKLFIFSTNIDVTTSMGEDFEPFLSADIDIGDLIVPNSKCYQFGEKNSFKLQLFKKLLEAKTLFEAELKLKNLNINEELKTEEYPGEIKDFFDKFIFMVTPDQTKLDPIVMTEIKKKLIEGEVEKKEENLILENAFDKLYCSVINWMIDERNDPINNKTSNSIFNKIKNNLSVSLRPSSLDWLDQIIKNLKQCIIIFTIQFNFFSNISKHFFFCIIYIKQVGGWFAPRTIMLQKRGHDRARCKGSIYHKLTFYICADK